MKKTGEKITVRKLINDENLSISYQPSLVKTDQIQIYWKQGENNENQNNLKNEKNGYIEVYFENKL